MMLVSVRVLQREFIGCVSLYPCIPSPLLATLPPYLPSLLPVIYLF